MIDLNELLGDKPTRVWLDSRSQRVMGGVKNESDVLRCMCVKGYGMKVNGQWRAVTQRGKPI